MILTDLRRIVKAGITNFWRTGTVSLSSVFIFTTTLYFLGSLIFLQALLDYTLMQIKDRVDVNTYFTTATDESQILSIKKRLETLPEVASVNYTSRDEALSQFKKRHENDYLTLQALDELGDNPLGASLNIKAKDPSQYESIVRFLQSDSLGAQSSGLIDKINYNQNKSVIDRLSNIIDGSKKIGFGVALALAILSILITFNTIRLVIYVAREEIGIMQLVGANDSYVRGPFIVGGIMYGIFSAIFALILFVPTTIWIGKTTTSFFGGINIFDYYTSHFFEVAFILLLAGVLLGTVSSVLAVRKYLN
jgi:cell division transport system permease protein